MVGSLAPEQFFHSLPEIPFEELRLREAVDRERPVREVFARVHAHQIETSLVMLQLAEALRYFFTVISTCGRNSSGSAPTTL